MVLRAGAALPMTRPHFLKPGTVAYNMGGKNRKTHGQEAVSFALNVSFLKEVSQNCFVVFGVFNFDVLRQCRRTASFLMLSTLILMKLAEFLRLGPVNFPCFEEVLQNGFLS